MDRLKCRDHLLSLLSPTTISPLVVKLILFLIFLQGTNVMATFDYKMIMSVKVPSLSSPNGFVAVGPDRFGVASFDNLRIMRADLSPVAPITSWHHQHHGLRSKTDLSYEERDVIVKESFDSAVNLL